MSPVPSERSDSSSFLCFQRQDPRRERQCQHGELSSLGTTYSIQCLGRSEYIQNLFTNREGCLPSISSDNPVSIIYHVVGVNVNHTLAKNHQFMVIQILDLISLLSFKNLIRRYFFIFRLSK